MLLTSVSLLAQEKNDSILEVEKPTIEYSYQRATYEIADITISGADSYEDFVLIGFSGLSVGDKIEIPVEQIT